MQTEDAVGIVISKTEVVANAHFIFCHIVILAVVLHGVQCNALLKDLDEVFHWLKVPKLLQVSCLLLDEVLAACNNLVDQLLEEFENFTF